jgi:hypothetical protein
MAQQNSPQIGSGSPQAQAVAPKVAAEKVSVAPAQPPTPTATTSAAKGKAVQKKSEAGAPATPAPPPRNAAQIQADMEATRQRLSQTIGQLQEELAPKNLARKQLEKVRSFYVDEYGAVRPDRVAMTAGAVVGGIVVIRTVKRVFS